MLARTKLRLVEPSRTAQCCMAMVQLFLKWTRRITAYPVDSTYQFHVVRELILTSNTGRDVQETSVHTSWQGVLGYVELEPIACPVEGLL